MGYNGSSYGILYFFNTKYDQPVLVLEALYIYFNRFIYLHMLLLPVFVCYFHSFNYILFRCAATVILPNMKEVHLRLVKSSSRRICQTMKVFQNYVKMNAEVLLEVSTMR